MRPALCLSLKRALRMRILPARIGIATIATRVCGSVREPIVMSWHAYNAVFAQVDTRVCNRRTNGNQMAYAKRKNILASEGTCTTTAV